VTSFLQAKGIPAIVERTLVRPPSSQLGPVTPEVRAAVIAGSPIKGKYDTVVDRDSAYERLRDRADAAANKAAIEAAREASAADASDARETGESREYSRARRYDGDRTEAPKRQTTSRRSDSVGEAFAKSFVRQLGTKSGQALVRGVLGTIFGKR